MEGYRVGIFLGGGREYLMGRMIRRIELWRKKKRGVGEGVW